MLAGTFPTAMPAALPWPGPGDRRVRVARAALHVAQHGLRTGLVESSIWTAATLAGLALGAGHLLGLGLDLRPAAVIGASGLLVYNLDHLADSHGEAGSAARWREGLGRRALELLVLGSALALAALLVPAPAAVGRVVLGYLLVGLLYGLPVLPLPGRGGLAWRRPKDLPGMKAVIVATSITVAAVGLPLAFAPAAAGAPAGMVAAFVWTLVFCNTVTWDVGDLAADRRSGVPTLPVLLGVRRTRLLLALLLLGLLGASAVAALRGTLPHVAEVVVTTTLLAASVGRVTERTTRQHLALLLDGCSFVPLAAALALHGLVG